MTEGSDGSSVTELLARRRQGKSEGPDWSGVSFEVSCGRCGASLTGQAEAQCPLCTLEFDWDDVLPADRMTCPHCGYGVFGLPLPRCPECGGTFKWPDVLAAARTRSGNLFEAQWYTDPLPALLRTWFLAALRPRKLWSLHDVHDPPKLVPLLVLVVLQWVLFNYGWDSLAGLALWGMNRLATAYETGQRFTYFSRMGPAFFTHVALWHLLTFLSFFVFVQSRRLYRIRWPHILRVYVHSTVFASCLTLAWIVLEWLIDFSLLCIPPLRSQVPGRLYVIVGQALFVIGLLATWRHIWVGYRDYLKVPRGWGDAALAMLLGYLLATLVGIYL